MSTSPPLSSDRPSPPWRLVIALLTTGVLWLAAAGKAAQVITQPVMEDRWFWTGILEVELLLGLVVLLGRRSRLVLNGAGCFFIVLALIAGAKGLQGATDCGCFGAVPMNPWITVTLDLILAALLLTPPPKISPQHSSPTAHSNTRRWAGILIVTFAGLAIASIVAATPPGTLQPDGHIDGSSDHIVLEPQSWIDQPFPLTPFLPTDAHFDTGSWEIFLARPGCPHCLDYLDQWEPSTNAQHVAIISLASPAGDLADAANARGFDLYTLDRDRHWYAQVPITLHLEDGVVCGVSLLGSREKEAGGQRRGGSTGESSGGGGGFDADLVDAVWFSAEGRIDLGYITPGSEHTLAYRINAPSDQALQLLGIHSECRCTTITQAPEQVEAGNEAIITMRFIATDKTLAYEQGVLIRTDHPDPRLAEQRIVVTARIGLPLSVAPAELRIDTHADVDSQPPCVTITNDGPNPIRLIYAVSESPGITAQVPREPIAPGQSVEIPIIARPDQWDGQPTRIRIPTTHPDQTDLFITVSRTDHQTSGP